MYWIWVGEFLKNFFMFLWYKSLIDEFYSVCLREIHNIVF